MTKRCENCDLLYSDTRDNCIMCGEVLIDHTPSIESLHAKGMGTGHRMFVMSIRKVHKPKLEAYEHVIKFRCPKCDTELDNVNCRCPMYHYRCPSCNTFYTLELYEKGIK